jgi:hypothetical protein
MSKMMEYLESAVGFDASGLPASTTQFTFGYTPFQIAETENLADLTTINTVCQCDAVVDIKIIDGVASVSFDFSNETNVFAEFVEELESYSAQKEHVTESLNLLMAELNNAERNEDQDAIDYITAQMRSMSIPFMLPTILPVIHGGEVQVGFTDDPLFVFYTSERLNQMPYKVTMIFDAQALFCQDDVTIYTEDTEAEIRAQQEEMWFMEEARKLEEAEYQAQFGYNADMYDDDDDKTDRRLKGVRFK